MIYLKTNLPLQYKIPRNVQLEDKIVAFLTMKQMIICGIGFGIAYIFYISLAKSYYVEVCGPPVFLIAGLTVAFAFVKIKQLSFAQWCLVMAEAMMLPHKRVWDKRYSTELLFKYMIPKVKPKKKEKKEEVKEQRSLEELTKQLDFGNRNLSTNNASN